MSLRKNRDFALNQAILVRKCGTIFDAEELQWARSVFGTYRLPAVAYAPPDYEPSKCGIANYHTVFLMFRLLQGVLGKYKHLQFGAQLVTCELDQIWTFPIVCTYHFDLHICTRRILFVDASISLLKNSNQMFFSVKMIWLIIIYRVIHWTWP